MNIVIAPDKFKDSLTGLQVGEAFERGVRRFNPQMEIRILPMADGGEGTVQALVDATRGEIRRARVHNPLMKPVEACYGILGDGTTAVIEMAAASGIGLLRPEERNPWLTTTYGTGELILQALNSGCRRIIMGIGGSATNDCGVGMAQALGIRFTNSVGDEVPHGGGGLGAIHSIDISGCDARVAETEFLVACDVSNVLSGPNGASQVYGSQKGASEAMVLQLDAHLAHVGQLIEYQLGMNVANVPGTGAAGGLGAGLMAFTNARLQPGFEMVSQITRLEEEIRKADLVITGEGKIDRQTQYGKTPLGVARLARKHNKPVVAIAGTLGEGYTQLFSYGFDGIYSIIDQPMDLEEALRTAPERIERLAESLMRTWEAFRKH